MPTFYSVTSLFRPSLFELTWFIGNFSEIGSKVGIFENTVKFNSYFWWLLHIQKHFLQNFSINIDFLEYWTIFDLTEFDNEKEMIRYSEILRCILYELNLRNSHTNRKDKNHFSYFSSIWNYSASSKANMVQDQLSSKMIQGERTKIGRERQMETNFFISAGNLLSKKWIKVI